MKPKYIIGILAALTLIGVAVFLVENKKIEYADFTFAKQSGSKVQIAGKWVKDKGCNYDAATNVFTFTMKDDKGNVMPVILNDAKPNNFELAQSVVVTGTVEQGTFKATHILTKCPSKYESDGNDIQKEL